MAYVVPDVALRNKIPKNFTALTESIRTNYGGGNMVLCVTRGNYEQIVIIACDLPLLAAS